MTGYTGRGHKRKKPNKGRVLLDAFTKEHKPFIRAVVRVDQAKGDVIAANYVVNSTNINVWRIYTTRGGEDLVDNARFLIAQRKLASAAGSRYVYIFTAGSIERREGDELIWGEVKTATGNQRIEGKS